MKTYQKCIRFDKIQLRVEESHPRDVSRVIFKLIQQGGVSHKTKKYGDVNPTSIDWTSPIEFKYLSQPAFKFQTICEHEYGYQIEQLKALYYGQIKVKPEDFFHVNRFDVYNKDGEKCGKISFMVKVIDREVGLKYNQEQQVQNRERIRVDLVGKMTFIQASLVADPIHFIQFQRKNSIKRTTQLQLQFDGNCFIGQLKQSYRWVFKGANKAQFYQKSADYVKVKIKEGQHFLLQGRISIQSLLKNKRFISQNVIMQNQKGTRVGTLKIEMRTVEKKQMLDLMYSPNKLSDSKMQSTDFQPQSSQSYEKSSSFSQPTLKKTDKHQSLNTSPHNLPGLRSSRIYSLETSPNQKNKNKYELYIRNRYQDIKFSKAKRFEDIKPKNPHVSYTGHNLMSDFSPVKKSKGNDFSRTQRTDFTKPFKNNPGTGDYHLPSIWERT